MVQVREFPSTPAFPITPGCSRQGRRWMVRYRGFVLMPQPRSQLAGAARASDPMGVLPFRTPSQFPFDDVRSLVTGASIKAA